MTSNQSQEPPLEAAGNDAVIPHDPETREVAVDEIQIGEFCRRDGENDDLTGLVGSIRTHGLLQPVSVQRKEDGSLSLIAGRRRFMAAKALNWTSIPCRVLAVSDAEAACLAWIENAQRQAPTLLDEACFFKRMIDRFGLTEEQIARQIGGLTQSMVSERLSLLELPESIRKCLGTNAEPAFSPTHGILLARLMKSDRVGEADMVRKLFRKIIVGKVSTAELRAVVKLITDKDFAKLPAVVQHLLLTHPKMTMGMLVFLQEPSVLVQGEGRLAALMRVRADQIPQEERVAFVEQCVSHGRSLEEAQRTWLTRLRHRVNTETDPCAAAVDRMFGIMAALLNAAEELRHHHATVRDLSAHQIERLQHESDMIGDAIGAFIDEVAAARRKAAPETRVLSSDTKEVSHDSVGQN